MSNTVIRCQEPKCNKDLTGKVQVFDRAEQKIYCQNCNAKKPAK